MRLDKYLSDMGIGTRSEIKGYIRKGRLKVNGQSVIRPEMQVSGDDDILFDGKLISYVFMEYYMLYKPSGVLSASRDGREATVVDMITDRKRKGLFPVGRLDKDTEGLLLITNDGELAHRLLSPKRHVPKVYFVRVDGRITQETVLRFQDGIRVDGEFTALPAKLKILRSDMSESEAELTIYEGKFHQVKRMFAAAGLTVTYLKRLSMGSLVLEEALGKGGFRPLFKEEVEGLYRDADALRQKGSTLC